MPGGICRKLAVPVSGEKRQLFFYAKPFQTCVFFSMCTYYLIKMSMEKVLGKVLLPGILWQVT
jgi:hypothetical protein